MPSDEILLHRYIRERDAEAFRLLVERYADMVYHTCLRVTGSTSDAEDASQECFLELARGAREVRRHLGAWLHTVARRRAMRCLDRRGTQDRVRQALGHLPNDDSAEPVGDLVERVDEALARLPERERAILLLRFVEGLPQTAVAERLGVDQATVSRGERRGLERLRGLLRVGAATLVAEGLHAAGSLGAAPAEVSTVAAKVGLAAPLAAGGVGSVGIAAAAVLLTGAAAASLVAFWPSAELAPAAQSDPSPTTPAAVTVEEAAGDDAPALDAELAAAIAQLDRARLEALAASPVGEYHAAIRHVDAADAKAYPTIGLDWLLATVDGEPPGLQPLAAGPAILTLVDGDAVSHRIAVDDAAVIDHVPVWRPALAHLRGEHRDAAWDDLVLVACERAVDAPALAAKALAAARAAGWRDTALATSLAARIALAEDRPQQAWELVADAAAGDRRAVHHLRYAAALAMGRPDRAAGVLRARPDFFAGLEEPRLGTADEDLAGATADRDRGCALPLGEHWTADVIHATDSLWMWGGRNGSLAVLPDWGDGVMRFRGRMLRNSPSFYQPEIAATWHYFRAGLDPIPGDWDDWAPWIAGMQDRLVARFTVRVDGSWRLVVPGGDLVAWGGPRAGTPLDLRVIRDGERWQWQCHGARIAAYTLPDSAGPLDVLITGSNYAELAFDQAEVDGFGTETRSALVRAILADDAAAVAAAITAGADPDAQIGDATNALGAAAFGGRLAALRVLLTADGDREPSEDAAPREVVAVHAACQFARHAVIDALIAQSLNLAEVITENPDHQWAWIVLDRRDPELIARIAALNVLPEEAWLVPLSHVQPGPEIRGILRAHGVDLGWYGAICDDDGQALARLLAEDPELVSATLGGKGATPLHYAVNRRRHARAQQLIDAGAEVDAETADNQNTPLHWAISRTRDLAMVQLLLAAGADPRHVVRWGEDAIGMAERYRFAAALPLLREAAAQLDAHDAAQQPAAEDF